MNKNKFAITPPMGWNSYDYYDTTVYVPFSADDWCRAYQNG